jgi:tRNA A-37 threonylcarbamoyl transferase component Bud32
MAKVELPRLRPATEDASTIARIIRGALRLQVERVRLVSAPATPGEHILELDIPGDTVVQLLAEPLGPATAEGYALRVRPLSRVQMAELFSLVERLDDPSTTVPPPADALFDEGGGTDDTIFEGALVSPALRPGAMGADAYAAPSNGPLSSDPPTAALIFDPGPRRPLTVPTVAAPGPSAPVHAVLVPAPAPAPAPAVQPARRADPRIGRTVGNRYRIDALLGSGAAAAVYKAMHLDLQRQVAVKILHAQNQSDPQFVGRFKAEALAASKLEHLNVARVLDFGQDDSGELYLVMELLLGQSMEALLAGSGRLPPRRAVDIAIQACRALAFAHEEGIIHRDVKPENIMVLARRDDDGALHDLVKVCDFGLAKLRDPDPEQGELTVAGMLCGSPAYMSPEQATGEQLDPRTDVYSLGVTLFESLTGAMPHDAPSLAELFLKKMSVAPRLVSELTPGIHPALDELVKSTLATDPADRPANARALLAALRSVANALPPGE